jgi:opacity protein-like surface antigen
LSFQKSTDETGNYLYLCQNPKFSISKIKIFIFSLFIKELIHCKLFLYKKRLAMFKLYTLFSLLILLTTTGVSAQNGRNGYPVEPGRFGGIAYLSAGWYEINIEQLSLRVFGEEEVRGFFDEFVTLGGGASAIYYNILLGGELQRFSHRDMPYKKNGEDFTASLKGGYAVVNIGYFIYNREIFSIYPMVGVGRGNLRLSISEAPKELHFNDMLNNPLRKMDIRTGGLYFTPSVAANAFRRGGDRWASGYTVGLVLGYSVVPKWKWKWENKVLEGDPYADMEGPFVKLTIGYGGFIKKRAPGRILFQ